MTFGMMYQICMISDVLYNGMNRKEDDGVIKKIQDKRDKFPTISDTDLNPESE